MDLSRDAAQLRQSDLLRALFGQWKQECLSTFENINPSDVDALVICNVKLRSVEEFREYAYDKLDQLSRPATGANATDSGAAH